MSQSKLFCHLSIWLIAAIMLLSSCENKKTDLLKMIPDDTDVIITFNTEKLLVSAGCEIDNNKIEWSNTLEKIFKKNIPLTMRHILNDFATLGCIDLHQAVFAIDHLDGTYLAFSVTDKKALKRFINERDIEFDNDEGFNIARIDKKTKTYLILKDNIGWLYSYNYKSKEKSLPTKIKNIIDRAEKKSVADISWKNDIFSAEHLASVMFNTEFFDNNYTNNGLKIKDLYKDKQYEDAEMACVIDLEGTSITITSNIYDHDGEKLELYPLFDKKIDDSFLKYVSFDDSFVLAFAIDSKIIYRLLSLLDRLGVEDVDIYGLKEITDLLEDIDGTISVAFGLTEGITLYNNLHNWDFVATVQLKQDKAEDLLNYCRLLCLSQSDLSVFTNNPSSLSITIPYDIYNNITINVEVIDNTFIVSNRQIEPKEKSKFDPTLFEDKVGVCIIDISADYINSILKELSKEIYTNINIPFGINFTGTVDQTSSVLTISLTETDGNFLEKIINWSYDSLMQFM